jgi:hypothetical protein
MSTLDRDRLKYQRLQQNLFDEMNISLDLGSLVSCLSTFHPNPLIFPPKTLVSL